jgi:hypothetical protein
MARNLLADEPVAPEPSRRRNLLADDVPPAPAAQPRREPPPKPPPPFEVAKIPESTVYGAIGGAVAPEMMKYGGRGLQVMPFGQPFAGTVGRAMEVSGEALKGQRGASTAAGAVGGFAGETATQLARSMGAPETLAIGAGIVSGMAAPSAISQFASRSPWVGSLVKKAEEGAYTEAAQRMMDRLRGGLPAATRKPQESVVSALENEARLIRERGQVQANQIISDAEARIAALGPQSMNQAAEIRRQASEQASALLARANRQVEQRKRALREVTQRQRFGEQTTAPETARRAIAEPQEATDIGQALRDKITQVQGTRVQARSAKAQADKDAVIQEVDAKQSAGIGVADEPKFQEAVAELQRRLGVGKARKEDPFAEMTEPRTRRTYQEIYNVLRPRQSEVNGVVQTPKVSFESLDALRRRLGEIYRSPPAEGADALDAKIAGDFYKKLSEILGDYSPQQRQFISNYEALSRELDVFKTAAGRRATAIDRYDPETFVTDPAKLPSNYFSTRTAVQDLIELTGGDKEFVKQQAASFVSRQLENVRTPQAAAEFEARNRDWLREFPDLQSAVKSYIDRLGFAETRTRRLADVGKALRTEIGQLPTQARRESGELLKEAERRARALETGPARISGEASKAATQARASAQSQARILERSPKQDQVTYFDSLVSSGDTKALEAAAPIIKRSPSLLDSFVNGVGVTLSRMDPMDVVDNYRRLVRPALERGGLATSQQLRQIDRQMQLIETVTTPELRPGAAINAIRNALVSGGAMTTTRLMDSLGLSFAEPVLGGPSAAR